MLSHKLDMLQFRILNKQYTEKELRRSIFLQGSECQFCRPVALKTTVSLYPERSLYPAIRKRGFSEKPD